MYYISIKGQQGSSGQLDFEGIEEKNWFAIITKGIQKNKGIAPKKKTMLLFQKY